MSPPLLVAPAAFAGELRATEVAAAVGRGIERAGHPPPDLCPVADGGPGTAEVLLLALGGETGDGFVLVEDGGTAIVEVAADAHATGARVAAAGAAGPAVVLLAAAGAALDAPVAGALADAGGLRGARLVVLCDRRTVVDDAVRAVAARTEDGAALVLEAVGFDGRMRAARAAIVGEGRLDVATAGGTVAGEMAVRARQAGVPCHAVCATSALSAFDARILDLQRIVAAPTLRALEDAGEFLANDL